MHNIFPAKNPHPRLYFHDGNVWLVTKATVYVVHQSILENYSEVFRKQLSSDCKGPRIIRLEEEDEELEDLLLCIYDRTHLNSEVPFEVVLRVLRIASRYEVQHLCKEMQARLERIYPHTFKSFISALQYGAYKIPKWLHVLIIQSAYQQSPPQQLAACLPISLYNAASFEMKEILEGVRGPKGKVFQIPTEALEVVLTGREALLLEEIRSIRTVVTEGVAFLSRHLSCSACRETQGKLNEVLPQVNATRNVLARTSLFQEANGQLWLCGETKEAIAQSWARQHERIWGILPKIFGISMLCN